MKLDFEHRQSAHCESGVTSSLLRESSLNKITEPLAFGIGAGLFFVYVPLIKINNGPAIAFRTFPGLIFKRTCNALGIPVVRKKFSSKEQAESYLKERLEEGHPVGCQVGVYYLSYFPREYRFHFNAHNLIVYGKEDDNYLISDPVMENPTSLTSYELERVRFAKGALAPKGQVYYPKSKAIITDEQIKKAIISGIKNNVNQMLRIPGSFAGIRGIKNTGKKIKRWRDKLGLQKAGSYLAQLVRMQEEIGTGGGGFRYIYAAFLQEAYAYVQKEELLAISKLFTEAGDLWRTAAVQAAGIYKGRIGSQKDFDVMGDYLIEISVLEKRGVPRLKKNKMGLNAELAVDIQNLGFHYPGNDGVTFSKLNLKVKKGERFGLFGPNGAGKTTLLSLMTGLLSADEGTIDLLGLDVKKQNKEVNKLFGFVPQDFSFYQELSPVENLEFFGAWSGLNRQQIKTRTDELLKILGLESVRNKAVDKFSGGMKRRVNLAIGVIHDPAILILDEPTVGVDVQTRHAIINYLMELNKKGTTLIYTSHQLSEAEGLCEQVALIDDGQIVAQDSLASLLKEHAQESLEDLFLNLTGKEYRN